ncbi:MAG: nucleotidyltransferase [Pseudomonadales bacterium]|nr:nucleotidyltransferase [Pseudomonadales bacterium]
MGGSGGFRNWGHRTIQSRVDTANQDAQAAEFESSIGELFADYLKNYNDRDTTLVKDRLDKIKELIADHTDETVDQNFGGSVSKNTYVDGLSDIDALLILNNTQMERSPEQAKTTIAQALADRLPAGCEVRTGELAVTVTYPDGQEIQLLPAVKSDNGGFKIQSATRDNSWSSINPRGFQEALTTRNQQCSGKLVPTIKLVKAINSGLPEAQQLSGYHIESLAIAAFRNYQGPRTTAHMVREFFSKATDLVRQPIKDSTGQSVHVDDYLGSANSGDRQRISHALSRVYRRIVNATANRDIGGFRDMFEGNE